MCESVYPLSTRCSRGSGWRGFKDSCTTRIANKAGVKFEWTRNQRFSISKDLIWDAGPSQEDLRDVALRAIERVDTDGGRSPVMYCLKPSHRTEIDISKYRPSHPSLAELCP